MYTFKQWNIGRHFIIRSRPNRTSTTQKYQLKLVNIMALNFFLSRFSLRLRLTVCICGCNQLSAVFLKPIESN